MIRLFAKLILETYSKHQYGACEKLRKQDIGKRKKKETKSREKWHHDVKHEDHRHHVGKGKKRNEESEGSIQLEFSVVKFAKRLV